MQRAAIVEATEGLYRSLFSAATAFAAGAAVWGVAIAPFNGFDHHQARSLVVGGLLTGIAVAAVGKRRDLYRLLRREQRWLLLAALLGVAVLWADGGWRSSYYLASYAAIGLAAVTGGLGWSLACALLLATGYVGGLVVHGYSWEKLQALHDADSVVANTGGYLIAAVFFAAPVNWLGAYVARIQQVTDRDRADQANPTRERTKTLTAREIQVVQLAAGGATNDAIATVLVVSPRTVESHIDKSMKKTGAKNRTELAVIAVREGLVPPEAPEPPERPESGEEPQFSGRQAPPIRTSTD